MSCRRATRSHVMRALTIKTADDEFGLADLLRLLEPELAASEWTLAGVEAVGDGAAELHRLDDDQVIVPGPMLLATAARVSQVIEGIFSARRDGKRWVVVRAV